MSEPVRVQLLCLEVFEPPVRYALNVPVLAKGLIEEGLVADCIGIELGGVRRFPSLDETAVVKVGLEFRPEVAESLVGVFLKTQQGLAVADLLDPPGVTVALDPKPEDPLEFLFVPAVLSVQGMKVIVVPGSGDQFLEGLFAVFGYGELLDKADWGTCGGWPKSARKEENRGDDAASFHGKKFFFQSQGRQGILPLNRREGFLVKQSDARGARILEDFRIF